MCLVGANQFSNVKNLRKSYIAELFGPKFFFVFQWVKKNNICPLKTSPRPMIFVEIKNLRGSVLVRELR